MKYWYPFWDRTCWLVPNLPSPPHQLLASFLQLVWLLSWLVRWLRLKETLEVGTEFPNMHACYAAPVTSTHCIVEYAKQCISKSVFSVHACVRSGKAWDHQWVRSGWWAAAACISIFGKLYFCILETVLLYLGNCHHQWHGKNLWAETKAQDDFKMYLGNMISCYSLSREGAQVPWAVPCTKF